jgi:hypothetical protein
MTMLRPFLPVGWRRGALSVVGGLVAAALLGGLAEAYLRSFPPKDLHPYLGEASPLTGPLAPNDDFGAGYRSWEAFQETNAEALARFGEFGRDEDPRPIWAMFGNSFVQAPDMLADTARVRLTDRRIFNLGRNEPLVIRLAQIALLLDHGLRPERIIVELMPLDTAPLGAHPLATYRVTSRGALTYEPRRPAGPGGWLIDHSRLAQTGWVRSGRERGNLAFRPGQLNDGVPPQLLDDLRRVFGNLARATQAHAVPVTVVLIPSYEQVMRGAPRGFQDALAPMLYQQGYDVCDPQAALVRQPDRAALFLPDKHLTPLGNRVLLDELLDHLRGAGVNAIAATGPGV